MSEQMPTGLTFEQAYGAIPQANPLFEVGDADIRGVTYKVFKNAPPNLKHLFATCLEHADKEFLYYEGERTTFGEYYAQCNKLAHALIEKGIGKGDRVALVMRNYPEFLIAWTAILSTGAVIVPMNGWWNTEELQYGFTDSGCKWAIVDAPRHANIVPFADGLGIQFISARGGIDGVDDIQDLIASQGDDKAAPPQNCEIGPEDDFCIMYTSGSSGKPKGVVMTHRSAITALLTWGMVLPARVMTGLVKQSDVEKPMATMITTPLFHVSASHANFMLSVLAGRKLVIMYKWDPKRAVELVEAENVTMFFGVPTMSMELIQAAKEMGREMPNLQSIDSGGAKRPDAQVGQLTDAVPHAKPGTGYGLTETNGMCALNFGDDYTSRPGSTGRILPPVQECEIRDEQHNALPLGEIGEVCVKSPANLREYLNRPDATAEALRDGWFYTGDLGYIDAEGFLYIVDRKKDMIIRGGENIACLEVEACMSAHPAINEITVFSVPDDRLNEVVGCAIYTHEGQSVSKEELVAWAKNEMAHYKVPVYIWFSPEALMRGGTGKIDRRNIREFCLRHLDAG